MKKILLPETINEALGMAVKAWRDNCGLKQTDVAERWDISQPTLSRMERGFGCTVKSLFAVCGPDAATVLQDAMDRLELSKQQQEDLKL